MSPEQVVLPYATWPSPVSTSDVARSGLHLGFPTVLGHEVWWTEDRPAEGGRTTIMHRGADGTRRELLRAPWSARTRVHEYGGQSYAVVPGRGVVFANLTDQRLYLLPSDGEPHPLTPEPDQPAALRYAEMILHDGQIWCVRERHHPDGTVSRSIVSIPLPAEDGGDDGNSEDEGNRGDGETVGDDRNAGDDGDAAEGADSGDDAARREPRERVGGSDFYASLAISPDGAHLAFVCWDHPRMPWNGTELRVFRLADGACRTIAGGPGESVLAPSWRDDHTLYLVSDRSGWWNLYRAGIDGSPPQALHPAEEEFAGPLWQLGGAPYAKLADGRLAVLHGQGDLRLGVLDPDRGVLRDLDVRYDGWLPVLATDGRAIAGIGYGPTSPRSVVRIDLGTGQVEELRRDVDELPEAAYLPRPRALRMESRSGRLVHAYLYPPTHPRARGTGAPPYVVFVHGGPTGHSTGALDLEKAFFTSRGIGVLDVNYGGSTGYGRAYRERLKGQWGVVDVEDAVGAAEWLAAEGLADPARIAIRGGSAGGWTVMAACCASDVFAGGVSYFGVSSLAPFVTTTHDFESHYVEWLIGPEDPALYAAREPLAQVGGVTCPMLLLQGLADPVVPPAQSQAFADALAERGVPCTYLTFEGEAHGFRRAETRSAALATELAFYQQIFHS
ncbi:dipeptidyl aminopeptidase/acylaminoacyl peptidase [Streptosporangium becharense]|uniref:Dipeptidyl aminopeptidase/acylaminoacyl peptidase n=1 Tax=Streptosporangium becharense TaxID=1816182 RepID=A0A7W9IE36_9ACTN|nr:prolyl oligopeptidase family serine peptidase [Streptosporangium becharense]MBB2912218.1 dipeptidyl aminopeptidase/acylaminoacyl peptidase [Streptosporangium becharense]MBB5818765.1 dipeptidyl aminopeptidase/acylaminoacyl peptidase [Streptosporangium becharense]